MSPTLRSPRFTISLPAATIAAGGNYFVNLATNPATAEQIPYNNIFIRNYSTGRYMLEYGDTKAVLGQSEIYSDDTAYGTTSLKITNIDNTAQDDLIFITLSREVTAQAAIVAYLTSQNLAKVTNGDI